jgi:hypothetical protein
VSRTAQEAVELRLAETGSELRAAIEAAQYARIVSHDELGSPAEAAAAGGFVARFEACAEAGGDGSEAAQRQMLATLSPHLEALEACGLFVHWGIVRRALITPERGRVTLPMAILTISRSALPTRVVLVPDELGIAPGDAAPRH